jgi:integrase
MQRRTTTAKWTGNRWRIDVRKDGERRSFYSSTPGKVGQREANSKADRWLESGTIDENRRVISLWEEYLESVKASSGTSNYEQIRKSGENYILPVIGNLKIGALTVGHLQDVLNRSYKSGTLRKGAKRQSKGPLSRKTLQGIRFAEKNFLRWARQHNYTTLTAEDLQVPKSARLKGKKILQPDAVRILFSCDTRICRGKRVFDEYIYAFRFLVSTGLRPGELVGLHIGDIDGRTVNLDGAINRYGEETLGKNENAIRSFDMNDYALEAYLHQLELLRTAGFKMFRTDPLFPMRNQQSLYNRWRHYQKSNDIPPISLYEMRHTFVSMAQDMPDGKLKLLVGHSRNMDTRGVYGHQRTGDAQATAKDLTDLFNEVLLPENQGGGQNGGQIA